jgi:hypothetical protein
MFKQIIKYIMYLRVHVSFIMHKRPCSWKCTKLWTIVNNTEHSGQGRQHNSLDMRGRSYNGSAQDSHVHHDIATEPLMCENAHNRTQLYLKPSATMGEGIIIQFLCSYCPVSALNVLASPWYTARMWAYIPHPDSTIQATWSHTLTVTTPRQSQHCMGVSLQLQKHCPCRQVPNSHSFVLSCTQIQQEVHRTTLLTILHEVASYNSRLYHASGS